MTEHNQAALMYFEGNILAALNDKLLTELKVKKVLRNGDERDEAKRNE